MDVELKEFIFKNKQLNRILNTAPVVVLGTFLVFQIFPTILARNLLLMKMGISNMTSAVASIIKLSATRSTSKFFHWRVHIMVSERLNMLTRI